MGVQVGYLPGSAMRKAAQLLSGDATTDARDAYVIAFTARHMPDTLRDCCTDDETMARLKILSGFDDDLAFGCNRQVNRLRSRLLQIPPRSNAPSRATASRATPPDAARALRRAKRDETVRRHTRGQWAKSAGLRRCGGILDDLFDAIGQ